MTIIFIAGQDKSNASMIGNALRNNQISKRQGGLLVDDGDTGEPRYQIEKLLNGVPLPDAPVSADQLPWKDNATAIFIGDNKALLDKFEVLVPGFAEHLGPVIKLNIE